MGTRLAVALLACALCGLTARALTPDGGAQAPALQALIDATPDGATLRLAPGTYRGPARIERALTLDGGGRALLLGDGRSTVLSIHGSGVTVRGLRLRGSGDSQDRGDSGLLVHGSAHVLEDNELDDVLFGIHLKGVRHTTVRGNRVRGKALAPALRGDLLRLWNSQHNRIEGNTFTRGRDLTLMNSPDNRVAHNHFTDGRFGMHVVFSPRLHAHDNALAHTGTGIVVLYSPGLVLQRNQVAHALTDGGAGIVIRESADSTIEHNRVLHCAVGLKADSPQGAAGRLWVRGNHFAHNIVGVFLYGEAGAGEFTHNRFEHNLTTVAISAPGAGSATRWSDNFWDDYRGFDLDRDAVGDTPHEPLLFADRLWMELPLAGFFRNSPALELLDLLERLAPFTAPYRLLSDARPRLHGLSTGAPPPRP